MQLIPVFAPSPKVRVLIADSDADDRRRLRNVLEAESDFDVVGEADDGALALQLAHWLRPSVMLLDPHLRGVPSLDLARALITEIPEVRVMLLTGTSVSSPAAPSAARIEPAVCNHDVDDHAGLFRRTLECDLSESDRVRKAGGVNARPQLKRAPGAVCGCGRTGDALVDVERRGESVDEFVRDVLADLCLVADADNTTGPRLRTTSRPAGRSFEGHRYHRS